MTHASEGSHTPGTSVVPTPALTARPVLAMRDTYTTEQIDLLKRTVAKGASDDEFALFLRQCQRTGLDPFARQIYCLARRQNVDGQWVVQMVTQVGIDGFRLIASRSPDYQGQSTPVFYDVAGNGRTVWLDPKKPPYACAVGIHRANFTEPLTAVALYSEYVQNKRDGTPNAMWATKPTVMLAKCAEAMALRKAFPQELSGLYAEEEVPGEPDEVTPREVATAHTRPRPVLANEMGARVNEMGDVELTFGIYKGRALRDVPTSYLLHNFRDPWRHDPERQATATARLGAGFVAAVLGELARREVPDDLTVEIALMLERAAGGASLSSEDAETVRQWAMDHGVGAAVATAPVLAAAPPVTPVELGAVHVG